MSEQTDPSKEASANEQESQAAQETAAAQADPGSPSDVSPAPELSTQATTEQPSMPAADISAASSTAAATTSAGSPSSSAPAASGGALSASGSATTPKTASAKSRSTSEAGRSATSRASRADESKTTPSAARGTSAPPSSRGTRRKRMKLGELDLTQAKIGFIGAGKMAESTINGLINYAKISPQQIHVAAPSTKGLERFKSLGCRVTKRNYDIFGRYDCDIIFLCFHGYVIKHCYKLGGARPHPLTTNYIPHQRHPVYILSLVSGVSLSQIKACLLNPESTKSYVFEIHRIMMNTAVGHGLGICAIDCEPDSKKLSAPLRQLLSSIAHLEHVPASQMDAACAIGGSGLAFSYYFINALADGAFKMGLSRQQAIRFASKTAQCAAQTMLESGKHPAELRDTVSSPSGAAIYGIHVLEKNDVASGVTAAVEAAHKRAHDLSTQDQSS